MAERRLIPDVSFKTSLQVRQKSLVAAKRALEKSRLTAHPPLQVLRRAPQHSRHEYTAHFEQQTPLQYLLRGLSKCSAYPREVQVRMAWCRA